jgi:hypothetical protein
MTPIIHQLQTVQTPCGCIAIDAAATIEAATPFIAPPSRRQKFPRFIVIVDEKRFEADRVSAFRRFISQIQGGSKCLMFRNMGGGVTLNFDDLT